ncbi:PAS domain S-box protein [Leptolyngbya sp. FACHB-671]|uniref:sensor histidine kinase n=1 Tax=Leptolyngbya sp. FACHB-671 TaxID=2692812 RepID=UPI001686718A|nr:ATP-binding protein [Leptolyngbya sp. FACHB-671]MBD2068182.1 PAS domain S-box protein [Leptolyngbya sp. FACHB-671]
MQIPLPTNELDRLNDLYQHQILDTEPEQLFDDLTRLAAHICQTPIALITLLDTERQWFKSKVGVDISETPRNISFCNHTILQTDVLVVPNLLLDERFAANPLVTSEHHIRFYAGCPLITSKGHALGSICVVDRQPRELSAEQINALRALGRQVVSQLKTRRNLAAVTRLTVKRTQTENTLWQSREQFRSLVEQTNDWVWEVDAKAIFTYVSPKVKEILGHKPDSLLGKTLEHLMLPDEAKRYATVFGYSAAQQQPFTQLEETLIHKDGHPIVCESSGAPVFDQQGQFQGYRGITRDITERKQVEREIRKALTKEKELNELKSRFVNTVSHEFRTPLTTILASAESLEYYSHKWSEEKKLTYLNSIQSAVHHLRELVDGVLVLGCAEAGKLEFKPTPLDLEKFCRELTEDMQLSIGKHHQLSFTVQGPRTQAYMDERLLKQIFINLLSNAIKYSPNRSQIDFRLIYEQDAVIFQVQDSGIGIPLADQEHLFESFHRATNVGNISGTGLGLSIVKRSVELHKGRISATSTVGVGTTFTVILPTQNNVFN